MSLEGARPAMTQYLYICATISIVIGQKYIEKCNAIIKHLQMIGMEYHQKAVCIAEFSEVASKKYDIRRYVTTEGVVVSTHVASNVVFNR